MNHGHWLGLVTLPVEPDEPDEQEQQGEREEDVEEGQTSQLSRRHAAEDTEGGSPLPGTPC